MALSEGVYPGKRVSYDGALCTIRCQINNIPGTKGEWLGVEWDDPNRGKHNGTHAGKRYFQCRSIHPTIASFVKLVRRADPERTILEAIKSKYMVDPTQNKLYETIVVSGKVAEEIGFDKIHREQSELANLKVVILERMSVSGIASRGSTPACAKEAREELARACPSVIELDLSHNPLETWADVEAICAALPKLRTLRLNNVRFRDLEPDPQNRGCFENVQELHLNGCLLDFLQVANILRSSRGLTFPSLRSLWLSQNEQSEFKLPNSTDRLMMIESIQSLMLENNLIKSLDPMVSILSFLPRLTHVSLRSNLVSSLGPTISDTRKQYSDMVSLDLSQNSIDSFNFIDALPQIFPKLSSLRISKNPVYDAILPGSSAVNQTERSYYLTLARLPKLRVLNYTTITARERDEGEIYYLATVERDIKAILNGIDSNIPATAAVALAEIERLFPRYTRLCEKHDRDNLVTQFTSSGAANGNTVVKSTNNLDPQTYPPGTLASRMVTATFYIATDTAPASVHQAETGALAFTATSSFTRQVPNTIATSSIFGLVSQQTHIPLLAFRLVYESKELDPVQDDLTTRSQIYADPKRGANRWDDWGDWDADALVERSLGTNKTSGGDGQVLAAVDTNAGTDNERGEEEEEEEGEGEQEGQGRWTDDGILLKNGKKWRRREVDMLFGTRSWGDWLEDGVRVARIRIEFVNRKKWTT